MYWSLCPTLYPDSDTTSYPRVCNMYLLKTLLTSLTIKFMRIQLQTFGPCGALHTEGDQGPWIVQISYQLTVRGFGYQRAKTKSYYQQGWELSESAKFMISTHNFKFQEIVTTILRNVDSDYKGFIINFFHAASALSAGVVGMTTKNRPG